MSSVGSIGGADKQLANFPSKVTANNKETALVTPEDKVEIRKDISMARKVLETAVGAPLGVIEGARHAGGGLIGGGFSVFSKDPEVTEIGYKLGLGVTTAAIIGALTNPVIGVTIVAFYTLSLIPNEKLGLENVSKEVELAAQKGLADNQPSGSKVKDMTRDFSEGGVTGMYKGAIHGFKEGTAYGAGILSGIIEGTKGVVTTLTGRYEKPVEKPAETGEKTGFTRKLLKGLFRVPAAIIGTALGTVGAAIGMGMEAVDGFMQGDDLGIYNIGKADMETRSTIIRREAELIGAATGFMAGGPVGAAIGFGSGFILGQLIDYIEYKTGSNEEVVKNLTSGVRHAQKDNIYEKPAEKNEDQEKNTYETIRDRIEGVLTGTAAGMREGAITGFQAGKGVTDGIFDGIMGITDGIVDGVADGVSGITGRSAKK